MNQQEFMHRNEELWNKISHDDETLDDLKNRTDDTINDRKNLYRQLDNLKNYKITVRDLKKQKLYVLVSYNHDYDSFMAVAQIGLNFTNYDFHEPAFVDSCSNSLFGIYADPLCHFTKHVVDKEHGLKAKYPKYHIYCLNDYHDEHDFMNHVSDVKYMDVF